MSAEDIEDIRWDDRLRKVYLARLLRHPDPRDPDYPEPLDDEDEEADELLHR